MEASDAKVADLFWWRGHLLGRSGPNIRHSHAKPRPGRPLRGAPAEGGGVLARRVLRCNARPRDIARAGPDLPQQSLAKEALHVAPAVGDGVDDHVSSLDGVDDAIGLEVGLAELADADPVQLLRDVAARRK